MQRKSRVENRYYTSMVGSLTDLMGILTELGVSFDSKTTEQARWMSWHARNLEKRILDGRAFYEGDNSSTILTKSAVLTYEQIGTLLTGRLDTDRFSISLKKTPVGVNYNILSSNKSDADYLETIIQGFYLSQDIETARKYIRKIKRLNHQEKVPQNKGTSWFSWFRKIYRI